MFPCHDVQFEGALGARRVEHRVGNLIPFSSEFLVSTARIELQRENQASLLDKLILLVDLHTKQAWLTVKGET